MANKTEYTVLRAPDAKKLGELVWQYVCNGWNIDGNSVKNRNKIWEQRLVRRENEETN